QASSVKLPEVPEYKVISESVSVPPVKSVDTSTVATFAGTVKENHTSSVGFVPLKQDPLASKESVAKTLVPLVLVPSQNAASTVSTIASAISSFVGGGGADSVVKLQTGQPTASVVPFTGTIFQYNNISYPVIVIKASVVVKLPIRP